MSRHTHAVDDAHWAAFVDRHTVGDVVYGDVVETVPFGAFVRIGEVDGFAPKSEWPTPPPADAAVPVRILAIDTGNRRFSVGPA